MLSQTWCGTARLQDLDCAVPLKLQRGSPRETRDPGVGSSACSPELQCLPDTSWLSKERFEVSYLTPLLHWFPVLGTAFQSAVKNCTVCHCVCLEGFEWELWIALPIRMLSPKLVLDPLPAPSPASLRVHTPCLSPVRAGTERRVWNHCSNGSQEMLWFRCCCSQQVTKLQHCGLGTAERRRRPNPLIIIWFIQFMSTCGPEEVTPNKSCLASLYA